MKALAHEVGYFVIGIAMFLVFCVAFYLVWQAQSAINSFLF